MDDNDPQEKHKDDNENGTEGKTTGPKEDDEAEDEGKWLCFATVLGTLAALLGGVVLVFQRCCPDGLNEPQIDPAT